MGDKEIYEKILNKKFTRSVFTGYETVDVDQFFDFVIDYLKQNEKDTASFKKVSIDLKLENDNLRKTIIEKDQEIANLIKKIKQYEDDGYANVSHNKRIQEEINKKGAK